MALRAAALLGGWVCGHPVVGWKDPRTSLTLPFWRTASQIDATVLVIRHPLEVARSLRVRNAIDEAEAARLYVAYVVSALRNDPACVLVRYEDLFLDIDREIERLGTELGLRIPVGDDRAEVAAVVKDPLRSAWLESLAAEGPATAGAVAVYRLLSESRRDAVLDLAGPLLDWARSDGAG